MNKAVDPLTGREFIKTRINQRFSCPENRIKYYNQKANEVRHALFYINKPLFTNYRILNQVMNGKSEGVFHKEFLRGKGFTFSIFTHYEKHEDIARTSIYNFILIALDNNNIKVIRNTND